MKARGLILTGDLVKATLERRKRMTRRVVKLRRKG